MRNLLPYPFAPYNGVFSSKAFNTGNGSQKGLMIGLNILWASYQANGQALGSANPNFTINANLNIAGPNTVAAQWTIESVYIDNEGVDFPVYVYFPDTQFTVSCPANSAGWYQVFTNARAALIAGIGIPDSSISGTQRTAVFFTDAAMVPSLDQENPSFVPLYRGSTLIQRTNSLLPGFGPPALGDQTLSALSNISGAVPFSQVVLPKASSGFYYITNIQFQAMYREAEFIGAGDGGIQWAGFLGDLTSSQSLLAWESILIVPEQTGGTAATGSDDRPAQILSAGNMNLRLDATHDYGFRLTQAAGFGSATLSGWSLFLSCWFAYTLSPT